MIDEPEQTEEREAPKRPRVSRWAVVRSVSGTILTLLVMSGLAITGLALFHPDTPLPDGWNPTVPFAVSDPVTPLTSWKMRAALGDPDQCVATLQAAGRVRAMSPLEATENCHIRNRVSLSAVGDTAIDPIETSCATALRLAMWEQHGVQPAAREHLGSDVTVIRQIGSYNCRQIRTTSGNSARWSTHATGDAIDITGFDLVNGARIRLISDWNGDPANADFLRDVRDAACTWFATTLSPDFNSLHADHFHLQARGWGTCR